jgi:hypothetical protein
MADVCRVVRNGMRVDRSVAAVREVETSAFFCLCSSCNNMTEVVKNVRFAQLPLKEFKQNYGDSVNVFVLYIGISVSEGLVASFYRGNKIR